MSGSLSCDCPVVDDLFKVVSERDLEAILAAHLNHQDFGIRDANGNNLLHAAVKSGYRIMVRAIISLTSRLKLDTLKNNEGKLPIDYAVDGLIRQDIQLLMMKCPALNSHHSAVNYTLAEQIRKKAKEGNNNFKVLLSIDGGGIKGILISSVFEGLTSRALIGKYLFSARDSASDIACSMFSALNQMLREIEHELGEPLMRRVHWLAGTSVGGIISLGLGSGFSADDLQRVFLKHRQQTFCGNSKIFPKHDSKGIESVLHTYFKKNMTMDKIQSHKVMVTTARVTHAPPNLVLFRTYAPRITPQEYERHGYLNPERLLVWKCARATSAAPVYFESFHDLADGAIFCNNPCIALIADFLRLKKLENHLGVHNADEIGCIISIGSGDEPVQFLGGIDINLNSKTSVTDYFNMFGRGKNLITLFMFQCTSSHNVPVGQAREWAHSIGVPFYRFSPRLAKAVELDCIELESIFSFMFETEVYIRVNAQRDISECVRVLKSMRRVENWTEQRHL